MAANFQNGKIFYDTIFAGSVVFNCIKSSFTIYIVSFESLLCKCPVLCGGRVMALHASKVERR